MEFQGTPEDGRGTPVKINAQDMEIGKLFECPVCYDVMTPPIIVCSSGHAICNFCKENLRKCPTCRGQFTEIRNRLAEDFLDMCLVQCKYREAGCNVRLPGRELSVHHKSCDFRPLTCQTCEQEIPYLKFLEHMRVDEKLETQTATECSTGFEIEDEEVRSQQAERFSVWEPTWIRAYDRDFFCFLETVKPHWWIWVGLFGTADECKNYVCSVTVWNKEQKTELKYVGKIHPIRTPREDVLKTGHCLIFLDVNLKNFMYKGGIDVLVRIDQEYAAPRTRKGSVVESPVTIFGKKSPKAGEGSRANRLNRFCIQSRTGYLTQQNDEATVNNSDATMVGVDALDISGWMANPDDVES